VHLHPKTSCFAPIPITPCSKFLSTCFNTIASRSLFAAGSAALAVDLDLSAGHTWQTKRHRQQRHPSGRVSRSHHGRQGNRKDGTLLGLFFCSFGYNDAPGVISSCSSGSRQRGLPRGFKFIAINSSCLGIKRFFQQLALVIDEC